MYTLIIIYICYAGRKENHWNYDTKVNEFVVDKPFIFAIVLKDAPMSAMVWGTVIYPLGYTNDDTTRQQAPKQLVTKNNTPNTAAYNNCNVNIFFIILNLFYLITLIIIIY